MRLLLVLSLFFFFLIDGYSQDTRGGDRDNNASRSKNKIGRTLLDDSTKTMYGMNTTSYILSSQLLDGDTNFIQVDSSLNNFEKFSVFEKNKMRFQNLGNLGTPLGDLFDRTPKLFNVSSGFNSLDSYYNVIRNNKFYNTKSPFIDLELILGGKGRNKVDFLFTRNINKNWNIGFDIHRIASDKQIGATKTKGDRNVNSSAFNFFVYHESKNKKVKLFSSFLNFSHQILGTGGIDLEIEDLPLEYFLYNDSEVRLSKVENNDKRKSYNVFFEYKLLKKFKIYANVEYYTQNISYNDDNLSLNVLYYDSILNDNVVTADSFKLSSLRNRIGIKGSIARIEYNFYANYNLLNYKYSLDSLKSNINENFIGGKLRFKKDKFAINSSINLKTNGNYEFIGKINNKFFDASYTSGLYNPNILENYYNGNHYYWNNDFKSKFVNKLSFNVKIDYKNIFFSPRIELISINNHIYFSDSKMPIQNDDMINYNVFGFDLKLGLFNNLIKFENEYYYSIVGESSKEIIKLPTHHNYSRIYYTSKWFNNSIPVQFGINIYYRSKYFGDAYDPVIQNYYIQDSFRLENYFRTNIFFSMQVKNLRIFAKMTHFNQFDTYGGYFVTPYYPGQNKVLDLGFRWYFFN